MDIKHCYNSLASQKAYLSKSGLMKSEEAIFSLISRDAYILDLGCGGGRTTIELHNMGFHKVIALDFAEQLIKGAKEKFPMIAEKFSVGDATDLSDFPSQSFDIVFFSFNGIDYLSTREDRLHAFQEISRVLKQEGLFIFSSHNRWCLPINRNLLKTYIRNFFRLRQEYWYTKQSFGDIPTYYSSISRLEKDLSSFNFQREMIVPNVSLLFPLFDTFPYYIFKKL